MRPDICEKAIMVGANPTRHYEVKGINAVAE